MAKELAQIAASKIHYEYSRAWWDECAPQHEKYRLLFEKAEAKRNEISKIILSVIWPEYASVQGGCPSESEGPRGEIPNASAGVNSPDL